MSNQQHRRAALVYRKLDPEKQKLFQQKIITQRDLAGLFPGVAIPCTE